MRQSILTIRPDFPFSGSLPEPHYAGLLCEAVFQTGAVFLSDHLQAGSLTDESATPVLSRIRDAFQKNGQAAMWLKSRFPLVRKWANSFL